MICTYFSIINVILKSIPSFEFLRESIGLVITLYIDAVFCGECIHTQNSQSSKVKVRPLHHVVSGLFEGTDRIHDRNILDSV